MKQGQQAQDQSVGIISGLWGIGLSLLVWSLASGVRGGGTVALSVRAQRRGTGWFACERCALR